jgi:hypothetical protein
VSNYSSTCPQSQELTVAALSPNLVFTMYVISIYSIAYRASLGRYPPSCIHVLFSIPAMTIFIVIIAIHGLARFRMGLFKNLL